MNFVEELKWRGMIHDIMPGTEEFLLKEKTAGYIGFDPTSDALHIGSLVQIMILVHFQMALQKTQIIQVSQGKEHSIDGFETQQDQLNMIFQLQLTVPEQLL